MPGSVQEPSRERLREAAYPLVGTSADYDPLLALVGDARFVLLGGASHGTHEFSRERAFVTKRLIREKGFSAVALAADADAAARVSRYVSCSGSDADADAALSSFHFFPRWPARSREVAEFVSWLRDHNEAREEKVGFFGLDVFALSSSAANLLARLERSDPAAAVRARHRLAALDHVREEAPAGLGLTAAGEAALVRELADLCSRRLTALRKDAHGDADGFFWAELSPRLLREAESHYAALFRGRTACGNARSLHMAAVLESIAADLERRGRSPKVVAWAHDSCVGDSRATERPETISVGRLLREREPGAALLVGFSSWRGRVLAADSWGGEPLERDLPAALPESVESLFHDLDLPRFLLPLATSGLSEPRLQRSVGAVYAAASERLSHYETVRLASRFDAVIHVDETTALHPLDALSVPAVRQPTAPSYPR